MPPSTDNLRVLFEDKWYPRVEKVFFKRVGVVVLGGMVISVPPIGKLLLPKPASKIMPTVMD